MQKIIVTLLALFILTPIKIYALTGEEIIAQMDKNRNYQSIIYVGTMEIHVNKKVRFKNLRVEALTGKRDRALVEFTNPEDEGTKYLMIDKNLWIYFPEEEDIVKISGHMLKEGMMGSDVSYEDALESDLLSEKYKITLSGEEKFKDHDCYLITLDAKVKRVPYYKRKMWVSKETFIALKEEMYAKSGKLLKLAHVLDIATVDGRRIPIRTEMINKLRKNSKTVFTMKDIIFNQDIDEQKFSIRYLRQ